MYIVSFRSRTSTMAFSRILKNFSIPCQVINTPKQISSSCSLSIQTNLDFQPLKTILIKSNIKDYIGIFIYRLRAYSRIF